MVRNTSAHRGAVLLCALSVLPYAAGSIGAQVPATPDTTRTAPDSARRLGTVTITAAPAERAAASTSTRVDSATIRSTPAHDGYDLLRQTAGLEVHQQGQGPGFSSNASLRGFSSDHSTDLALWIDGVPINEPVNGHAEGNNDFNVLFPGGISEFDVIRGPTSALYGNFALGGVINVRTVERVRENQLSVLAGSFGRRDVMGLTGFDRANGGGVLGARYLHENGFRRNQRSDIGQGHARIVRDIAPGVTVDGGFELYGARWNSPGFLTEDEFARRDYDVVSNPTDGGFKRRAQERLSLRVVHGNVLWRSTLYATQSRWQLFLTIPPEGGRFEGTESQTEEEDWRNGYGFTSAITRGFERAELTLGGEARLEQSAYRNYFTTLRVRDSAQSLVDARQLSAAAFFQSRIDLTTFWRADIGGRYDVLGTRSAPADGNQPTIVTSATHGVFSPKVGTLLRLTPSLGFYVNVSRGFRSTDGVISDPTLAPITAWSYESGLKVDLRSLTANVSAFQMNVSNEQTFNPLNGNSSNGGTSRRRGLELGLRALVTNVGSLTTDWTLLDARYRSLLVEGDAGPLVLNGLRVYNTSSYVGAAAYSLTSPNQRWTARVAANWVGKYAPFDEPGVTLGGYGLLHLTAGLMFGRADASIGISNVLNRAYPEVVAGHIVSPGQPRAYFFSVRSRL